MVKHVCFWPRFLIKTKEEEFNMKYKILIGTNVILILILIGLTYHHLYKIKALENEVKSVQDKIAQQKEIHETKIALLKMKVATAKEVQGNQSKLSLGEILTHLSQTMKLERQKINYSMKEDINFSEDQIQALNKLVNDFHKKKMQLIFSQNNQTQNNKDLEAELSRWLQEKLMAIMNQDQYELFKSKGYAQQLNLTPLP